MDIAAIMIGANMVEKNDNSGSDDPKRRTYHVT